MGWMRKKNGTMWGDEPQDAMDDALAAKLGREWYHKTFPPDQVRRALNSIMQNKRLRAKIDKIYKREWGRRATAKEFQGLIWGIKIK